MAVDKIPQYRNVFYDYKTDDDTFIARGLHLNELNDKLSMVIDEVADLEALVDGVWIDNGTSLSPRTSGHDILLRDNTERILFGDGDSYIVEISDDVPALYVLGGAIQTWSASGVSIYGNILPQTTTKTRDLGSTTRFWRNTYTDRLYIDDAATYVDIDVSSNMTFTDAVTGTVTLASLVGGGSTYTFSSGLSESGGAVALGNAAGVTQNTYITNDGETYYLQFRSQFAGGSRSAYVDSISGNIGIISFSNSTYTNTGARVSTIYQGGTYTTYAIDASNNTSGVAFTQTQMLVTDTINGLGFHYAADYSVANAANDRWLTDKGYVDSVAGSIVLYGATTQVPYTNTTADGFLYVTGFTFDGSNLTATSLIASSGFDNAQLTATYLSFSDNAINYIQAHNPSGYIAIRTNGRPASEANSNAVFHADQSVSLPGLAGLETETYFVAINNTTGLLTKRSVASLSGGGTVTSVSSTTTNQLTVATGTTTPALTIVTAAVANAETGLATGDQIYDFVIGQGYSTTVGTVTSVTGTGTVSGITLTGTVTSTGNLTLGGTLSVSSVTGTLPVANGGTGIATVGVNYMLTGNGTGALTAEPNLTFSGATLSVTGAITATGEITAYASDKRLKTEIKRIHDPIAKIKLLDGVTYKWRPDVCKRVGFVPVHEVETGMIAQNLASVIKDAVGFAPFDRDFNGNSISGEDYLTVKLEKNIPLIIEALKEVIFRLEKVEKQ